MAAKKDTITQDTPPAPILLTDGAVAAATIQNQETHNLRIYDTPTDTAPAIDDDCIIFAPGDGHTGPLVDIMPDLGEGAVYLWAWSPLSIRVLIRHA